jgi:hypothetical protein
VFNLERALVAAHDFVRYQALGVTRVTWIPKPRRGLSLNQRADAQYFRIFRFKCRTIPFATSAFSIALPSSISELNGIGRAGLIACARLE